MSIAKIVICGSRGRMGQAVIASAKGDPDFQIVGEVDRDDDLSEPVAQCDVIVEFAFHEATVATAKLAAKYNKALVIGTTGHTEKEILAIREIASPVPVVWSSNFSTGVNTLFWIAGKVAHVLGVNWGAEIIETHHIAKKDAPSGTAKAMQAIVKRELGKDVPIHALRIGDVVGDHTVTFGTVGERLELSHRASSRETYARGALRAVKWVLQQKPGVYDMQDVLGLH